MNLLRLLGLMLLMSMSLISRASFLDSLIKKQHFEFSFGQSLLFISNSKQVNIKNQAAVIIPTNAILFFAEFRPQKKIEDTGFFKSCNRDKTICGKRTNSK